jgi:hypothetical protein
MICPFCLCFFCYDAADMTILGADHKIYCSDYCKRKIDKKKNLERPIHCKRKEHYETNFLALATMAERGWSNTGHIYQCCNRGWQITKQSKRN